MQKRRNSAEHIWKIMEEVRVQVIISRELCEETHNLRQANAELREFLRETLLKSWSRREQRTEK